MFDFEAVAWCAMLIVAGVIVVVHYHLMANFITDAPHWVRCLALPASVGFGVGMVVCGLTGNWIAGLKFALFCLYGVLAVAIAMWLARVHASKEFAKAAYFRKNKQMMIREWGIAGTDITEGWDEFEQDWAKQREKTCN